ncbi:hypothetical protein PPTG_03527 [Phytophthora nicotianae INRA-310]|uniref:Uncharacterized protein n=2 Tax=Phytophthora nicotianae TaxID=4792 RepID=W2R554_PHYN3|nr:hypothetical protein PPTG_03527 [Phytophthora nicotianae INRA-310]ETN20542.1 hypothetical protein PPTG_03527 [Phytophthora nicotianae INRA-310]
MNIANAGEPRTEAPAPAQLPATSHKRAGFADDAEEKSNVAAPKRAATTTLVATPRLLVTMGGGDHMSKMLTLMEGLAGRLERLEESQTKMEQRLADDNKCARDTDQPMTPPMNSSLFASRVGRGARMHLDSLAGSPSTPRTTPPRRPAVVLLCPEKVARKCFS